MDASKLVLIDGNAIIHRAYHAMPKLTTPDGKPIGATQGFINILLRIIEDHNPTHIAVCWDRPEPTFRKKLFSEYQSQRDKPDDELISQFETIKSAVKSIGIVQYEKKGFEADDIIGTLSKKASEVKGVKSVIIVTGDKDQLQLVSKKVKVYMPIKGLSVGALMDEKEVEKKLGVRPEQVVDLKGFMGDTSDNYPGVYGVGPKTAQNLLDQYDSYPNVYKHIKDIQSENENLAKKLIDGKENGDISYKLAKIVTDVDVAFDLKKLDKWEIGKEETVDLFKSYGFRSLTRRIEDIRKKNEATKQRTLF